MPSPASAIALPATLLLLTACGARSSLDLAAALTPPTHDAAADTPHPLDAAPLDTGAAPTCSPGILAKGLVLPSDLVLDSTSLYWITEESPAGTTEEQIDRCGKIGNASGPPDTLASAVANASGLVRVDARLLWAEASNGTVNACDVAACAPVTLTTLDDPPFALATDATDIYIASYRSLSRCGAAGCVAPTTLTTLSQPPAALVVDDTDVYFLDTSSPPAVRACAKPDCEGGPRTVVLVGDAYDLRVDDENVYVCVGAGSTDPDTAGAILSCPKSGCTTPTTIARGLHHPGAIALDATRIYWADQGTSAMNYADGDIESCPKSGGGEPVVLASSQPLPAAIAVDDGCVYWATDALGGASTGTIQAARTE